MLRLHRTAPTAMRETRHCSCRMTAASPMLQSHRLLRLAAAEAATTAATSELYRADRSLAAGTMAAMAVSFLLSATCYDINARNQAKQRKPLARTAEQNSLELRQEMGIFYTTSANNEKEDRGRAHSSRPKKKKNRKQTSTRQGTATRKISVSDPCDLRPIHCPMW